MGFLNVHLFVNELDNAYFTKQIFWKRFWVAKSYATVCLNCFFGMAIFWTQIFHMSPSSSMHTKSSTTSLLTSSCLHLLQSPKYISREDGGAVHCCHQGLVCIPSTAVEGRQDRSHLARHSWSFTAARRRRPQPVHWKRHHQAVNRRAWPRCVHRCRADILWTCQTCHQQLLFPSVTSPPNT